MNRCDRNFIALSFFKLDAKWISEIVKAKSMQFRDYCTIINIMILSVLMFLFIKLVLSENGLDQG